jgi:hypothetical protein
VNKKLGVALTLAATVVATTTTTYAAPTTTTLPGGSALGVEITNPLDGAVFSAGSPVTISGTASVDNAPAEKNTDLVFVLDTSGSTNTTPNGSTCGTILDCEKAAMLEIINQANAPRSPINLVGGAAFPSSSKLYLTSPTSSEIGDFLGSLAPGNGTDFSLGLANALEVLEDSTAPNQLMVFLTDGAGTHNGDITEYEVVILAFTIGGQLCTPELEDTIAQGLPEGECTEVSQISDLSGTIQETIGSSLDSVSLKIDGSTVPVTTNPALPQNGPASATFTTAPITTLAAGSHTACATATGHDATNVSTTTPPDCVTFSVLPAGGAFVDCGAVAGDCTATATEAGKSTLKFAAPGAFDETVTIIPNSGSPTACGGQKCATGYDVLFPTTSATGPIVSVTVTTANKVTILQRLNAAVYMDNTRITAQCSNKIIIKLVRTILGKPEPIPCISITLLSNGKLEYFLKVRADPGVRFR